MTNKEIADRIKGKLIVSCQALKEEPLHSSFIMARMAYAAMLGGAAGIRANSVEDITEIRKVVDLPIIGIIKIDYDDSKVYITPTIKEVDALATCGCDIIALDATNELRPFNITIDELFNEIRQKYPDQLFMADCSTVEEGINASKIGFDFIGTTLNGYTEYTKDNELPNISMINELVEKCDKPVIAEGGIWCPEDLKKVFDAGAFSAVVGTAITRPMEITKRYVEVLQSS